MSSKISKQSHKWLTGLTNEQFKKLLTVISESSEQEIDRRITVKSIFQNRNQETLDFIEQQIKLPSVKTQLKEILDLEPISEKTEKISEKDIKVIGKSTPQQIIQEETKEVVSKIKQPRLKKPVKQLKSLPFKKTTKQIDLVKLSQFLNLEEIRSSLPSIKQLQNLHAEGKMDESEMLSQINQTLKSARSNNAGFEAKYRIAIEKSAQSLSQSSARGQMPVNEQDLTFFKNKSNEMSEITPVYKQQQSVMFDKLARAVNPQLQRSFGQLNTMSMDKSLSGDVRKQLLSVSQRISERGSQFSLQQRSAVQSFIENVSRIKSLDSQKSINKSVKILENDTRVIDKSTSQQNIKEEQQSDIKTLVNADIERQQESFVPDNEIIPKTSDLDQTKLKSGKSFQDVMENPLIKTIIQREVDKSDLTQDQAALLHNIFEDEQSTIDNAADLGEDFLSESLNSSFLRDIPDSTISQFGDIKAVSSSGQIFSAQQILNTIPEIVKRVGEIEGNIDLNQKNLSYYKKQTSIYKQQVQYKESNDFKIKSGTAFRTRVCC